MRRYMMTITALMLLASCTQAAWPPKISIFKSRQAKAAKAAPATQPASRPATLPATQPAVSSVAAAGTRANEEPVAQPPVSSNEAVSTQLFSSPASRPHELALQEDDYPIHDGSPGEHGTLRVWACAPECEINPVTGNSLDEGTFAQPEEAGRYRDSNAVWDGNKHRVVLFAGRNDAAAFQLVLQNTGDRPVTDITIRLRGIWQDSGLSFKEVEAAKVGMFWEWFAREGSGLYHPDVLLPLTGPLAIPNPANGVKGQTVQPVYIEVHTPAGTPPGLYVIALQVEAEGASPFLVPVDLTVWDFELPDVPSFAVNLDVDGALPRLEAGPESRSQDVCRLAQDNRLNARIVPPDSGVTVATTQQAFETGQISVANASARGGLIESWLAGAQEFTSHTALASDAAYAISEAAQQAMFYPAERFGRDGLYGSLRIKALRDGQQDVECLAQLAGKFDVTRKELAGMLLGKIAAWKDQASDPQDQPAEVSFSRLTSDDLTRLRRLLGYNLHLSNTMK